jgi:hypothetical protein
MATKYSGDAVHGIHLLDAGQQPVVVRLAPRMAGEEQIVRIDAADADCVLDTARATAGHSLVDQTAMVLHEGTNSLSCPRETFAEGGRCDLQDLATDLARDTAHLAKDVDETVLAVQTQKHAPGCSRS